MTHRQTRRSFILEAGSAAFLPTAFASLKESSADSGATATVDESYWEKPVKNQRPWGEGIRRSAGALAGSWTEQDDKILREIYLDRKRSKSA